MPTAVAPRERLSLPVILTLALLLLLGPTVWLQKSLLIHARAGAIAHWSLLLLGLPYLTGLAVRLLRVRYRGSILITVAILAGMSAYPTFVDSPTGTSAPHLVPIYIVLVWGVSWLATLPLRTVYDVAHIRLHRLFRKTSGTGQNGSKTKRVIRRTAPSSSWVAPRYATIVATLQLLVGIISLGVSIMSILFLSGK